MSEKRYGLIGRRLGHSLSPEIHAHFGSYPYELVELEPEALSAFLERGTLAGFNVTIPYKEVVCARCDELSERAARIGAVNTVLRRDDGTLYGDNTDYDGFLYLCRQSKLDFRGVHVLVLGSGGAAKTVCAVLEDLGARATIVSRSGPVTYERATLLTDVEVIVNTTPVGMYPVLDESPLASLSAWPKLRAVLELIYNPAHTRLMMMAEARGLIAINGLGMLVSQALAAANRWMGIREDDTLVARVTHTVECDARNLILVGMPGAGKSTLGKRLAEVLERPFIDLDALVSECQGRTAAEIIREDGETAFRAVESATLKRALLLRRAVIATGGGTVLAEENRTLMRQNATVLWLKRPLDSLPIEGRPLSVAQGVAALAEQRYPLYESVADAVVDVQDALAQTLDATLALLKQAPRHVKVLKNGSESL